MPIVHDIFWKHKRCAPHLIFAYFAERIG
jgi:hypothetical protein